MKAIPEAPWHVHDQIRPYMTVRGNRGQTVVLKEVYCDGAGLNRRILNHVCHCVNSHAALIEACKAARLANNCTPDVDKLLDAALRAAGEEL